MPGCGLQGCEDAPSHLHLQSLGHQEAKRLSLSRKICLRQHNQIEPAMYQCAWTGVRLRSLFGQKLGCAAIRQAIRQAKGDAGTYLAHVQAQQ